MRIFTYVLTVHYLSYNGTHLGEQERLIEPEREREKRGVDGPTVLNLLPLALAPGTLVDDTPL